MHPPVPAARIASTEREKHGALKADVNRLHLPRIELPHVNRLASVAESLLRGHKHHRIELRYEKVPRRDAIVIGVRCARNANVVGHARARPEMAKQSDV